MKIIPKLSSNTLLIWPTATSSVSLIFRYPSFIDAVRDLDDCLSMCFLFATFPKSKKTHEIFINLCRRLTGMFGFAKSVVIAIFTKMANNDHSLLKTHEEAPPVPSKLSGYPNVPKNSTQRKEVVFKEKNIDVEIQRNNKNVRSTHRRYLCVPFASFWASEMVSTVFTADISGQLGHVQWASKW